MAEDQGLFNRMRTALKFISPDDITPPAKRMLEKILDEEQEKPEVCPYDCDVCHDEDCPCDRLGCAGYEEAQG